MRVAPLGSIIAWVTKPEENKEDETLELPAGWVYCDGKPILDGIWAGSHTPNLNGEKRFLRGGEYTDQLFMEEDNMQDHQHKETEHSHDTTVTGASVTIKVKDTYRRRLNVPARDCAVDCHDTYTADTNFDFTETSYTDSNTDFKITNADTTCGTKEVDTDDTGYRVGEETRPVNMA